MALIHQETGEAYYSLKNLATGKLMSESISNTSGDYIWNNDNKTSYYVVNDQTVRPYKVMRHTLGTDVSTDKEIYTEKDSTFEVSVRKSRNSKYIFITSGKYEFNRGILYGCK